MLDSLLFSHLAVQSGRVAVACGLFLTMYALGARALARVELEQPAERLLLRTAAGFAIVQFVVRWAGEVPYMLSPLGTLALFGALAVAGLAGRTREVLADLRTVRVPPEARTIAILLLSVAPLAMALTPAVSKDALIYHLRFPEMTLREGWWAVDPSNSASFYPAATSTLYLAALAIDASGVIAQLVHFGFFVLCLFAAAAIARRLGAKSGLTASVLLAAVPAVGIVAGWSWSDLSLLFALAAAVLALFNASIALSFVFLGLAAAVKYNVLLAGLPIAIAALAVAVRRRAWRQLAIGATAGAAVASPWWIANALSTGNPLYPLLSNDHRATQVIGSWSRAATQSWWDVWSGHFLAPQTLDEDVGGLLLLVLFVVALRAPRAAVLLTVAMWAVFLPFTTAMRLLLPAVAATAVVAGSVLEQLERRRVAAMLVVAFALRGGAVVAAHNGLFLNPYAAAAGLESERDYLARNFALAGLYERAAALPPEARVLSIHEVRLFRFPRPVLAPRVHDPSLLARYTTGATSVGEVLARLRRDGITHLLIAPEPVERGQPPTLPRAEERLVTAVVRASRVIDRGGRTMLLELPR